MVMQSPQIEWAQSRNLCFAVDLSHKRQRWGSGTGPGPVRSRRASKEAGSCLGCRDLDLLVDLGNEGREVAASAMFEGVRDGRTEDGPRLLRLFLPKGDRV